MAEITGINIAIGGRGKVDQGSIVLSFPVNIAHFGGWLQNILWRVEEKILGQMDFLKNRIKKDNFRKSFRLRSNKSTLLILNMTSSVGLTMRFQW